MPTPQEFDQEWKTGNREHARDMAREYVETHPEDVAPLMGASIEELVQVVTVCRQRGDEEARIVADMVLLTIHAPQQITGTANIGGAAAVAMAEAIIAEARSQ